MPAAYESAQVTTPELYDLKIDPGEFKNVAADHPEIVHRLLTFAETTCEDLGDALTNRKATGAREPGRIPKPSPITADLPNAQLHTRTRGSLC